jgi:hypothetical protein
MSPHFHRPGGPCFFGKIVTDPRSPMIAPAAPRRTGGVSGLLAAVLMTTGVCGAPARGEPVAASVYSRGRPAALPQAAQPSASTQPPPPAGEAPPAAPEAVPSAGPDGQGEVAHPAAAAVPPAEPVDPAVAADRAAQAERIVVSSFTMFRRAESVSLKLRQRVRVGDRVLVGTGRYVQVGQGDDLRFRFETTLTCDTETFEIAEIFDGLFCWLHRRAGPFPATLHRIDAQRVRTRLGELGAPDPTDTAVYLGGLQRVLWSARQWFVFAEAVPGELDGRPVWLVEGRWNPAPLSVLQPGLAEAAQQPGGIRPEQLPDGMPWAVRFSIGRSDLVPYRLEYLAIPGPRPVNAEPVQPIGVIDLVEIEVDGSVDPTAFYYQPATEGLIDISEPYAKMLGLMRP